VQVELVKDFGVVGKFTQTPNDLPIFVQASISSRRLLNRGMAHCTWIWKNAIRFFENRCCACHSTPHNFRPRLTLFALTAAINFWSDSTVGGGALTSTTTSFVVLLPAGESGWVFGSPADVPEIAVASTSASFRGVEPIARFG